MTLITNYRVNLFDAVHATRDASTRHMLFLAMPTVALKAFVASVELNEGTEDFEAIGHLRYREGDEPGDAPEEPFAREDWLAGWQSERNVGVARSLGRPAPTALDLLSLGSLHQSDPEAALQLASAEGLRFDRERQGRAA